MGARDFSCMVSGFSQVFKVTHVKRVSFQRKICWPADDTKTYFHLCEKNLCYLRVVTLVPLGQIYQDSRLSPIRNPVIHNTFEFLFEKPPVCNH